MCERESKVVAAGRQRTLTLTNNQCFCLLCASLGNLFSGYCTDYIFLVCFKRYFIYTVRVAHRGALRGDEEWNAQNQSGTCWVVSWISWCSPNSWVIEMLCTLLLSHFRPVQRMPWSAPTSQDCYKYWPTDLTWHRCCFCTKCSHIHSFHCMVPVEFVILSVMWLWGGLERK